MTQNFINQSAQYIINIINPNDISSKDIEDWINLELNAIEPNAYLSPHFVIPALRYLEPKSNIKILTVTKTSVGLSSLVGVFVFKLNNFSRYFPLPHIASFHSNHSYLSGVLADRHHAEIVIKLIFNYFKKLPTSWQGIVIEEHPSEGELYRLLDDTATEFGFKWLPIVEWDRKMLYIDRIEEARSSLSKNIKKNFKRRMNGLKELGEINCEIISQGNISSIHINEFLELENMGWKGKRKSSIYSNADDVLFFQKMVENFNKDERAFFMVLSLNGKTIASTTNLISGKSGFAFKIGWDTSYAKYSPGILNEILFLELAKSKLNQLEYIDSGTTGVSYLDEIWTEKRKINTGVYIPIKFEKIFSPLIRFGLQPGLVFAKTLKSKFNAY